MYLPEHFAETDTARIAEVIATAPLACIVAQTDSGLLANHIPLLTKPDGSLIGHIAKANDMHQTIADGQDVLAIFTSMEAYVSPNFYPSKQEHHRHVPTWNYITVHVHGTIRFQHDRQAKHAAVGLLTRVHERRVNGDSGWKMGDAPADYMAEMLENIVAFRITPTRIEAKSKLSQNREARDYDGAIKGLHASGAHRMADEMTQRVASSAPRE
ncbi:MAG: FMN-binding negative transcriptional regulator [Natronohydrobacter sp.]|nr:FMN-binding negative transcriptional regulator [Natronohydrobacter sp.]